VVIEMNTCEPVGSAVVSYVDATPPVTKGPNVPFVTAVVDEVAVGFGAAVSGAAEAEHPARAAAEASAPAASARVRTVNRAGRVKVFPRESGFWT
jgi:hypothetical protein